MARPKPWLKMWIEWVHDPKMLGLTLAEQGAWWRILSLAQECNADGRLVKGSGAALTINGIGTTLHMTAPKDFEAMKSMIKKMEAEDSLAWNQGTLTILHFKERQEQSPSSTPAAIRERVKLHRERKAVTENPLPPLTTPITKEGEGEGEGEGNSYVTAKNSLHVTEKSLHLSLPLAEIVKCHEENFGIITPILSEKFKDFVENYHGPVGWIKEAFAEAVKYKNRRWQYVEAILYSWQEKGGPHADRREPGGERDRLGAGPQDPLATYREAGWEVVGEDEPEAEAGNQDR